MHKYLKIATKADVERVVMAAATFRYLVQLHKDVPKAARFYSEGLGFKINVCTLRWAELHSGPLKLALLHSPRCISLSLNLIIALLIMEIMMNVTENFQPHHW